MIHVLIERHIADGMEATYEQTARSTLHHAFKAPGFISGETFQDLDNPLRRFVLCKFRTARDWHTWADSEERRHLLNLINPTLAEAERITLLEN